MKEDPCTPPPPTHRRHRVGEEGEAAFVLRAIQLGLRLSRPNSDKESYDFVVDNGHSFHRVQIKTTSKRASKGAYHVTVARGTRKDVPYKQHEIDFLIIHVIPEQTFYILPQKALAGRVALSVPTLTRKTPTPITQYRERWDFLLPNSNRKPNRHQFRKPPTFTLQACAEVKHANQSFQPTCHSEGLPALRNLLFTAQPV